MMPATKVTNKTMAIFFIFLKFDMQSNEKFMELFHLCMEFYHYGSQKTRHR